MVHEAMLQAVDAEPILGNRSKGRSHLASQPAPFRSPLGEYLPENRLPLSGTFLRRPRCCHQVSALPAVMGSKHD